MTQANIGRLDALVDLKIAMVAFADDTKAALAVAESEVRRLQDRLARETPAIWRRRLLQARDELAQGKSAMARKRFQRSDGYAPDTTEEDKAIKTALRRIEYAEAKLLEIKAWERRVHDSWNEFLGPARLLEDAVTGNPPRFVAELNLLIQAVENYLQLQAPTSPGIQESSSAGATESMARPMQNGEPAAISESDKSPQGE